MPHFIIILRMVMGILFGIVTVIRELRGLVQQLYKTPLFIQQARLTAKSPEINLEQYQIDMEKLFHKNQLHPRIKGVFTDSDIPFRQAFQEANLDAAFGFDLLVQLVLHKRAGLPVLVGILRKHFKGDVQATADALLRACEADLMDWNPTLNIFIVKFDIPADVQADLDRYQFPLPMIVEPRELKDNTDTGYFTAKNSVILRNNHHQEDVCLDHLNHMNKIKLTLNRDVASFIENKWKNLDKPKDGEDRKDFDKRKKAFEKYDRTARDVMAHLDIAGGVFHLTHKVDKRGRTYSQGYHVNYQGNTWNKAVIEFAEREVTNG